MTDTNGLIDSQEEYDKELAWFNGEMNELKKKSVLRDIQVSYKRFTDAINRAESIGLFPKEWCDEQRKKIIDGINNTNLRTLIKNKLLGKK
jgi:hypothetical protein